MHTVRANWDSVECKIPVQDSCLRFTRITGLPGYGSEGEYTEYPANKFKRIASKLALVILEAFR
jgi:hypothetical protein